MDMESLRGGGVGTVSVESAAFSGFSGGGFAVFSVVGGFGSSEAKYSLINSWYFSKLTFGAGKALGEGRPMAGGG